MNLHPFVSAVIHILQPVSCSHTHFLSLYKRTEMNCEATEDTLLMSEEEEQGVSSTSFYLEKSSNVGSI